jgi:hypothetical protein
MPKKIDLTGQKFGKLTVLYESPKRSGGHVCWHCLCECGNETDVDGKNLRSGHTTSCGCKKSAIKDDIIGMVFGKLKVIKYSDTKKYPGGASQSFWECECVCGNRCIVSRNHLITGHTSSCGCLQRENTSKTNSAKIKKGDIFGKLTVLEEAFRKNYNVYWKCQCECGSIINVNSTHLLSSHTTSCGCISSKGEEKISKILQKNNFFFNKEKRFNDLSNLRFDFYINNQYIIEFDGIQHFKQGGWNKTLESFQNSHKRDLIKNKYCFDNNIPLIRIPYDVDFDINDLKLETTNFLLTPENEEEYYESRK